MSSRGFVLAVTLCALLAAGSTTSASAAGVYGAGEVFSDAGGSPARDAFALLGAWGIYRGDSGLGGPARPRDTITRAEFAAVVVRLMGKEDSAGALAGYKPEFADGGQVPGWAWGYVNVATGQGIIRGYKQADGSHIFNAQASITHAEALAMLLRLLGLDDQATGLWPDNYVNLGSEVGLSRGVAVSADESATREDIALMAYNAMVEVPVGPNPQVHGLVPGRPISDDGVRSKVLHGTITGIDAVARSITLDCDPAGSKPGNYENRLGDVVALIGVESLNALMNLEAKVYLAGNKGDLRVAAVEVPGGSERLTGVFWRDIPKGEGTSFRQYLELADGRLIEYTNDGNWPSNGEVNRWRDWDLGLTLDRFGVADRDDAFLDVVIQTKKSSGRDVIGYLVGTIWESEDWYERYWWAAYDRDFLIMPGPDGIRAGGEGTRYWVTPKNLGPGESTLVVDADTLIRLNGKPVGFEDLREWDVLRVALDWTKSTDTEPAWRLKEPVAWRIEAYRETLSGIVVSHRQHNGDRYLSLNTPGGTREIRLHEDAGGLPVVGMPVAYALDGSGSGVCAVLEEHPSSMVLVMASFVESDSNGTRYFLVVDDRGESLTYRVSPADYEAGIRGQRYFSVGSIVEVERPFDAPDGRRYPLGLASSVLYFRSAAGADPGGSGSLRSGTIVSVSGDGVVVEAENGSFRVSASDLVVYQEGHRVKADGRRDPGGSIGEYIGIEGLQVGDEVWYLEDDGIRFILRAFRKGYWPSQASHRPSVMGGAARS